MAPAVCCPSGPHHRWGFRRELNWRERRGPPREHADTRSPRDHLAHPVPEPTFPPLPPIPDRWLVPRDEGKLSPLTPAPSGSKPSALSEAAPETQNSTPRVHPSALILPFSGLRTSFVSMTDKERPLSAVLRAGSARPLVRDAGAQASARPESDVHVHRMPGPLRTSGSREQRLRCVF